MQQNLHSAVLENREKLMLTGVTAVGSFDDRTVLLYTKLGELVILGRGLHMEQMSLETGDVTVTGEVQALRYGDRDRNAPQGFFGRLLR
ncbi:MAG: sporulation protein YabP [Oscillospiraceae bacterium]|nr:sporulation protein YabP [Oscillospiraceae bacterium]